MIGCLDFVRLVIIQILTSNMKRLSKDVLKRMEKLGFTSPYIADLNEFGDEAGKRLEDFVKRQHHGSMDWIEQTLHRRAHPRHLWADAQSAIVLGLNYGPKSDPLLTLGQSDRATISVYARGHDYHDLIKGRLKEISGLIARDTQEDIKVFVDTAPLMEKPLAEAAGLGWQGKHTNLVSRDYGSWLFIGTILSAAKLEPTSTETDHCGNCTACLDICPTQAFPAPYQLDARKCISYLTIEHAGPVEVELREKMGNRIYGCDDCLAVCPWNKFAVIGQEAKLAARDELNAPALEKLAALGEENFRAYFSRSPIKRIGWPRFLRNVLYAMGNSGIKSHLPIIEPYIEDQNTGVKDAARWAKLELNKT